MIDRIGTQSSMASGFRCDIGTKIGPILLNQYLIIKDYFFIQRQTNNKLKICLISSFLTFSICSVWNIFIYGLVNN